VRHFSNRISEASAAWIMIGIAVLIATNPAAADAHSFDLIGVAVVDNWLAPAFLSVVGAVRSAALIANGNGPVYGPWMGAGGALLGALIWSQMCVLNLSGAGGASWTLSTIRLLRRSVPIRSSSPRSPSPSCSARFTS
jgi:hypothetical protein